MLSFAVQDLEEGVHVICRLDGSLFDPQRLKAKNEDAPNTYPRTLFAPDCTRLAHGDRDRRLALHNGSEASRLLWLAIRLGKAEVLHQAALNRNTPEPTTFVDGTQLKNVDNLIYLDSITSSGGSIGRENTSRISKASQALERILH